MTDVLLFLRQGWNHIWKQNNIFLLSSLMVLTQFMYFFARGPLEKPLLIFIPIIGLVFSFINLIGVPYLAYRFLIGNPAGVRDALTATRTYWPRVIGCSGLVLLIISPIVFILFFVANIFPPIRGETYTIFTMLGLLFTPFNSIVDFCLFGFFANNEDIGQSLKKAWSLFTAHFWTLAVLSVILSTLLRGSALLAAILSLLFQSGFDAASLSQIDFLNPGSLLNNNLLYIVISGVGQIILVPFTSLVHGSAYLKYTGIK